MDGARWTTGSRWWKRWQWLLLGAMVVAFLFLATAPARGTAAGERTVRLEASQYRFVPGTVSVNRGETVTIELVATDVVHGLYLDGYGLQIEADPGQTARLTFVADRAGTFRFRCSVSCGAMHPFMIGKLRVGQNNLLWAGAGLALLAVVAGLGVAGGRRG
ncbi:MAG TPA: cupredoxin domain-containing protein [Candidatus Sulfomarinibacteraceae bacterium]|nr:cupredoxin domain-containing protein [Candidatus Sulfomarinibacteraceae bacterium]